MKDEPKVNFEYKGEGWWNVTVTLNGKSLSKEGNDRHKLSIELVTQLIKGENG
jgi:hypothetical protein